jgi:hypothetical protein
MLYFLPKGHFHHRGHFLEELYDQGHFLRDILSDGHLIMGTFLQGQKIEDIS